MRIEPDEQQSSIAAVVKALVSFTGPAESFQARTMRSSATKLDGLDRALDHEDTLYAWHDSSSPMVPAARVGRKETNGRV